MPRESLEVIINLWRYRGTAVRNALTELRNRYTGSAAGVAWYVINPLAQITIYSLVFSQLMGPRIGGAPASTFALYLCAGLLPWLAFSECVLRGTDAFVENAPYLKGSSLIPEEVFVVQNAVSTTVFLGISMALLALVVVAWQSTPSITWFCAPLILLLFQTCGFGLGLALGTVNVFLRDTRQLLTMVFQLWMWLTPIVYVEDILPAGVRRMIRYNPAYPFIDGLHRAIVEDQWPSAWQWLAMLFWASAATVLGSLIFSRLRADMRDVL